MDYQDVVDFKEEGKRFSWNERDTMLYALAVGTGSDPLDRNDLAFVYEKNLKALPTLSTVVAWGAGISPDRLGLNRRQKLHGEEAVTPPRPLPGARDGIPPRRGGAVFVKS